MARAFAGDAKQLVPLIDAAFRHPGTSVIDIISPCVTLNQVTKSFKAVKREHPTFFTPIWVLFSPTKTHKSIIRREFKKFFWVDGSKLI